MATRITTKSKKCGLHGLYDGFTVRFASPHSRKKNRPKNIIDKQHPVLREIYLEGNRKVFNFKVQLEYKTDLLTISNVCSYIKGRLADKI